MLLLINDQDRRQIADHLRCLKTSHENDELSAWEFNELIEQVEGLGLDIEREFDEAIRIKVIGNTVGVLVNGDSVFEYQHPDPWALLATIHILDDRERDGKTEILIEWGHGCGWCNKDTMFTRLTHRSLLPEVAS